MKRKLLLLGLLSFGMLFNSNELKAQTAVNLSGGADEVQTTYNFDVTNGFTVEYRIYLNVLQNHNAGVTKGQGNQAGPIDTYMNSNGSMTIFLGNGGNTGSTSIPASTFATGQWYHIAVTADPAGTGKVYIDGTLASTFAHSGLGNTGNPMIIGDRIDNATNSNALYDNVRIWSGIRSDAEIMANRDLCLTGSETGLEILYQMEEGSGVTLNDLAIGDGAQNGTIIGGGTWGAGFACTVPCVIADQTVAAAQATFICSGSTTIDLGSSENGKWYHLRDDSNDSLVGTLVQGDGNAISFNTGELTTTTTYNVYAGQPSETGLSFDGVNENIVVPHHADLQPAGNQFTAEIWAKSNVALWNAYGVVMSKRNSYFMHPIQGSNVMQFIVYTDGTNGGINYPVADITEWHHYAMSWDGTTLYGYVDGVLVGTSPCTGNLAPSTDDLYMGKDNCCGVRQFNGSIDDARFWNVSRTYSEIRDNYLNELIGTEPGLVMYLPMNEASGMTANDLTGNGHNAAAINIEPADWVPGAYVTDCNMEMTQTATVTINPIGDQTVAITDAALCPGNSGTTVTTGSSENGVTYYLRDDANDTIVDGPLAGTGSGLSFNTGALANSMDYNVFAEALGTNGGMSFDGTNQFVEMAATSSGLPQGSSARTVEAWVKTTQTSLGNIVSWGRRSSNMRFSVCVGIGKVYFIGEGNDVPGNTIINDGVWHHIAVSYDGSNIKIYVDGVLDINAGIPALNTTDQNLRLGNMTLPFNGEYYNGELADVRIWNDERTLAEITGNMNGALTGSEPDLLAYYNFNEGSGSVLGDVTSNGNDGTLTNGPTWSLGNTFASCSQEMTTTVSVTLNSIATHTVNANVCNGSSYTYADGTTSTGITVDESHISTLTGAAANGCDSVVTENLTVIPHATNTVNANVCNGSSYTYADGTTSTGITVDESHVSTLTGAAANGCDSVVTENLTVIPVATHTVNADVCSGGFYTYADGTTSTGITVDESHVSTLTGAAANGCDSIVTENLTVIPTATHTVNLDLCSGSSHTYADGTTSSNITADESHVSTLTGAAANGCDSIVTENITILPLGTHTINTDVCSGGSYTYADGTVSTGVTMNESHVSTLTGAAANGCDSVVTENVNVLSVPTITIDSNICAGTDYTYADGTISTSIIVNESHVSTLVAAAANGCDSIVTENVTVITVDTSTTVNGVTISSNSTGASAYQWLDCDNSNAVISGESNQDFTATANGNYAVEVTENGCTDTSLCVSIANVGIAENDFANSILIYPNPTNHLVHVQMDNNSQEFGYVLTSADGRIVDQKDGMNTSNFSINIQNESNGVYYLRITNNSNTAVYKVVKN